MSEDLYITLQCFFGNNLTKRDVRNVKTRGKVF